MLMLSCPLTFLVIVIVAVGNEGGGIPFSNASVGDGGSSGVVVVTVVVMAVVVAGIHVHSLNDRQRGGRG